MLPSPGTAVMHSSRFGTHSTAALIRGPSSQYSPGNFAQWPEFLGRPVVKPGWQQHLALHRGRLVVLVVICLAGKTRVLLPRSLRPPPRTPLLGVRSGTGCSRLSALLREWLGVVATLHRSKPRTKTPGPSQTVARACENCGHS